jgi:ferredoxin-thioredoxin reductase catalytic subunit
MMQRYRMKEIGISHLPIGDGEWVKYADATTYANEKENKAVENARFARQAYIDEAVQREREEIAQMVEKWRSGPCVMETISGLVRRIRSRGDDGKPKCTCELENPTPKDDHFADCPCYKKPGKIDRIPMIEQWSDEGRKVINALNELIDRVNEL